MRIKEEFKRKGYFWLPSAPDEQVRGTLTISDGGKIELEVDEQLGTSIDNLERIVGYIQKGTSIISIPVTLDDCYYKKISLSGNSESLIRASRVFEGFQYGEGETPHFNTLSFSVEGIDDWISITGFKVEDIDKSGTPTISYDQPPDFSFKLKNDIDLRIIWRSSWNYTIAKEAVISEKRYFQLYSTEACELDKFISVARKITEFLCFAINETVSLNSMSATSDDLLEDVGNRKMGLKPIKIYYQSWPYSNDEPKINLPKTLFGFKEIQNDAEKKINNWLKSSEKFADAFRLYFLAKAGTQTYFEERFLTLAQGLEAYHQRTQSNRMKFKIRLERIIKPFEDLIGTNQKSSVLIDSIVDTRNYETHHDVSLKPRAAKGRDLWILCLKMAVLFELHILNLIGFSKEEIQSIVDNCYDLQRKLKS